MNDGKVLVIEPDRKESSTWEAVLRFLDYTPVIVPDIEHIEWPSAPRQSDWIAVMFGDSASSGALQKFLEQLRSHDLVTPLVRVGSADAPQFDALQCLQMELPIRYPQLSSVLKRAQELRQASSAASISLAASRYRPTGRSAGIRQINRLIEQVAPHDAHVLVLGESGAGKEMVARHVHESSPRAAGPFVPVNCGAIPAELLESELFGHERGAFTGAVASRRGRCEIAEGGTLFLDEIGDMSLQMQVKILRMLQERTIERVGSNRSIFCDVRIIAATHRDLEAGIREGWFRQDLYYRLNVFPIQMPPLRDRIDDLPFLIEDCIARSQLRGGGSIVFEPAALAALASYPWPGNVRELANLLERLSILHAGCRIGVHDLPERYRVAASSLTADPLFISSPANAGEGEGGGMAWPADGLDLKDHLNTIEVTMIRRALAQSGGTIAAAARLLRMRRTTLVEKLRKYGL